MVRQGILDGLHREVWALGSQCLKAERSRLSCGTPRWLRRILSGSTVYQAFLKRRGAMERNDLFPLFQSLTTALLRQYGKTPELQEYLPGEIYYQFRRLVDSYDLEQGVPLARYVRRRLPPRIFHYVRNYWRADRHDCWPAGDEWVAAVDALCRDICLNAPRAAVAALPHPQRLALVWRYYDHRSVVQIAADLGVSPSTVGSLLRHAVASLRTRAAKEWAAEHSWAGKIHTEPVDQTNPAAIRGASREASRTAGLLCAEAATLCSTARALRAQSATLRTRGVSALSWARQLELTV